MRLERLYLIDIVEAADHIAEFIAEDDFAAFEKSAKRRRTFPQDLTNRYPEVPWPQIVSFRNILVHAYFGIDWDLVWRSAINRCPVLRAQVASILATEFGGPKDENAK